MNSKVVNWTHCKIACELVKLFDLFEIATKHSMYGKYTFDTEFEVHFTTTDTWICVFSLNSLAMIYKSKNIQLGKTTSIPPSFRATTKMTVLILYIFIKQRVAPFSFVHHKSPSRQKETTIAAQCGRHSERF